MATAVTKAVKRTAKKAVANKVQYMHVISERTKLFKWEPIEVYSSYEDAVMRRRVLEEDSIYGGSGYKQTRVVVKG